MRYAKDPTHLIAAFTLVLASAVVLLTLPLSSAAQQPELTPAPLAPGGKLQVLSTTSIVADVVSQIGGDAAEVKALLPAGTDPHTFEPTPQDLTAVTRADVIFASGAGLEHFIEKMLTNAGANVPVVYLSEGVQLREMLPGEGEQHEAEESAGELQGGASLQDQAAEDGDHDPHTWTSPINVIVWTHNAAAALSQLDPAHSDDYAARAAAYEGELNTLDAWISEQVSQIPAERRKLVSDHLTLGYFADRYGFMLIGAIIPGFSTASQPSAQELAQLQDLVREHGVPAVFVSFSVNDTLSRRLAEDTNVKLVKLYSEALGPAASGTETYLDFMRYNTNAIVQALK